MCRCAVCIRYLPPFNTTTGDLQEHDKLETAARESDAVIHLGFIHDWAKFDESVQIDLKVLEAFKRALAGSNKIFIGM